MPPALRNFISFIQDLFRQNLSAFVYMALLAVIPLIVSSGLLAVFYKYSDFFSNLSLLQQMLFFGVAAFAMALALTPTTFVALIAGFFFGWAALPGMVLSFIAALVIARLIANGIDHGKLWAFLHRFDRVSIALHELGRQQFGVIVMTRLSPVLPFALMNFVLSVMQVRQRDYLLGSTLGMLPRTTFFMLLGTQGQRLIDLFQNPDQDSTYHLFAVGLVLVSMFGLLYFFTRAIQKAVTGNPVHPVNQSNDR